MILELVGAMIVVKIAKVVKVVEAVKIR